MTIRLRGRPALALGLFVLAGVAVLAVAWIDAGREPVKDQVVSVAVPELGK
ncbi:hypothetical protein HT136_04095 [Novosphingobium profundi]|uniref:hypothetical protein n=1 Tax=Novosphingobium profundi TaxID=1774954 RepID=UPI001BDB3868|nr:hypothetical protein [Novosphingobium profundi]MBT0667547.1 hypothetical protein [Novosphingobium profundi]